MDLLLGTVLGFLSGLGVGGGSLLILWLTLVLDMDRETARTINLMFFLPCALGSLLVRRGQKAPLRKLLPAMAADCAAAYFCSRLELDTSLLGKLFGGLLIVTGLRELFYRPKEKREGH